jgi:hypothetical protein
MATLAPGGGTYADPPGTANLSTGQTGTGASTNDVDRGKWTGMGLVVITTTVGATPTCTYLIEGSMDRATWFAIPYADIATPQTVAVATFTITTATTARKILPAGYPWRFVRVTYSANTNVTNTADVWLYS